MTSGLESWPQLTLLLRLHDHSLTNLWDPKMPARILLPLLAFLLVACSDPGADPDPTDDAGVNEDTAHQNDAQGDPDADTDPDPDTDPDADTDPDDDEFADLIDRPELPEHLEGFCAPESYRVRDLGLPDLRGPEDFAHQRYIDPEAAAGGDGSLEAPFLSWDEARPLQSDTAYLQRRGTEIVLTSPVELTAGNILVGAYGEGPRPVLQAHPDLGSRMVNIASNDNVVRDLHLYVDEETHDDLVADDFIHQGYHGISTPYIAEPGSPNQPARNVIYNNVLYRSVLLHWGREVRILHNDVFFTHQNGMFLQNAEHVEVAYNRIIHPNHSFHLFEGPEICDQTICWGDGIQFSRVHHWYVHNNFIDRADTPNKATFIARIESTTPAAEPHYFECNTLRGPPGDNNRMLFVGWNMDNLVYQYNYLLGPSGSALWSHSAIDFSHNVIEGPLTSTEIFCEGDCRLEDNHRVP